MIVYLRDLRAMGRGQRRRTLNEMARRATGEPQSGSGLLADLLIFTAGVLFGALAVLLRT